MDDSGSAGVHRRTDQQGGSSRMLQAAVFLCGLAVMGIEMSASRLLAPFFGTSLFIWTNLIGAIMAALSLGYWLGGRLADRRPDAAVLYKIILTAGLMVAVIPYISHPVTSMAVPGIEKGDAAVVIGSLVSTILLFAVPIVLLGMVSPFAIRLASTGEEKLGKTAGSLYALSTFGSIAGTFLPALVTIPVLGTRRTILAFAAILVSVGAIGLTRRGMAVVPVALLLVAVAPFGPFRDTASLRVGELLEETESPYHYIQVTEKAGRRMLILNEGHAVHSIFETRTVPHRPLVGSVWDSMNTLPLLLGKPEKAPLDVLIVGLAAGTISKQFHYFFGPHYALHIDGVELDGTIVEMGRKYFEMNEPTLDVHVTDGRLYLSRAKKKWDLIIGDAYRQPYIPFHLATREYFQLVKEHLKPDGLMSINVGAQRKDSPVLQRIVGTVNDVFGNVHMMDVLNPAGSKFNNYVVIAGRPRLDMMLLDTTQAGIAGKVLETTKNFHFAALMQQRMSNIHPATVDPSVGILEDDRAPVEVLTDFMIFQLAAGS